MPIRCASSRATAFIADSVNSSRYEDVPIRFFRRTIAECSSGLLCVSAAIEAIAGTALFVVALPSFLIVEDRYLNPIYEYASSSWFTCVWNLGTFFVFNPGCGRLWNSEEEARFEMDRSNRGLIFKGALVVACIAFSVLNPCPTVFYGSYLMTRLILKNWEDYRLIERQPIPNRVREQPQVLEVNGPSRLIFRRRVRVIFRNARPLPQATQDGIAAMERFARGLRGNSESIEAIRANPARYAAGAYWCKKLLLDEQSPITPASKAAMEEQDPSCYPFMAAHVIYYFSFQKPTLPIPSFLKEVVQQGIRDLRAVLIVEPISDAFTEPAQRAIQELRTHGIGILEGMIPNDLEAFHGAVVDRPQFESVALLSSVIRQLASEEMQGGIFVSQCFQLAQCKREEERRPIAPAQPARNPLGADILEMIRQVQRQNEQLRANLLRMGPA